MVTAQIDIVFFAPTARRRFLSKRAAIRAEARAIIERKHQRVRPEHDEIGVTDPGFHWHDLPRADVLFRRLCRLVKVTRIDGCHKDMKDAATTRSAIATAINARMCPEGFVLVPREPTEAMQNAGRVAYGTPAYPGDAGAVWAAMIEAAGREG